RGDLLLALHVHHDPRASRAEPCVDLAGGQPPPQLGGAATGGVDPLDVRAAAPERDGAAAEERAADEGPAIVGLCIGPRPVARDAAIETDMEVVAAAVR